MLIARHGMLRVSTVRRKWLWMYRWISQRNKNAAWMTHKL